MTEDRPSPEVTIDIEQISAQLKIRPHIYLKLVTSFVESLDEKMRLFQESLGVEDREKMRMILHEIKGTAGNLRLYTITGPEAVLHTALKAGENRVILLHHFDILKSEVVKLKQYIATLPPRPAEGA